MRLASPSTSPGANEKPLTPACTSSSTAPHTLEQRIGTPMATASLMTKPQGSETLGRMSETVEASVSQTSFSLAKPKKITDRMFLSRTIRSISSRSGPSPQRTRSRGATPRSSQRSR